MQTESFQQQVVLVLIIKKEKNMKSYVLHFMFCESLEHMYVHYYKNVCYVDVYFMNNTNYGHCSTGFSLEEPSIVCTVVQRFTNHNCKFPGMLYNSL